MFEHLSITTLGNASCGLMCMATLVQLYISCMEQTITTLQKPRPMHILTKVPAINLSANLIVVSSQFSICEQILLQPCTIGHVSLPTKHFAATFSTVNTQDVHLHMCTRSDRSGVRAKVSPFFPSYE